MDEKVWMVAKKINGYIQWEFLFQLSTKNIVILYKNIKF